MASLVILLLRVLRCIWADNQGEEVPHLDMEKRGGFMHIAPERT